MRNRHVGSSAGSGAGRRFQKRASGCGNFIALIRQFWEEKVASMANWHVETSAGSGTGRRFQLFWNRPKIPTCRFRLEPGWSCGAGRFLSISKNRVHCTPPSLHSNLRCGAALRRRPRATRARSCGTLLLKRRRRSRRRWSLMTTPARPARPHPAPPDPGAP